MQNIATRTFLKLAIAGSLCICGCTVGPDYKKPDTQMPDAWQQELEKGLVTGEADIQVWWRNFDDPVLEELIRNADANNLDIREALWRIEESRSLRNFVKGEYLPSVDARGSYQRIRPGEKGVSAIPGGGDQYDLYSSGFDATWEIDVFGGIKRNVQFANRNLQASVENYRDVLVSLYSEVARNYIELRTAQARIRYAIENIDGQRQTFELTKNRYEAEIAPELDLRQAELNLANTESEIPALRIEAIEAMNRLAVLLGKAPGTLDAEVYEYSPLPEIMDDVTVGLPAELLRKRPDIRRAERELAAQTALIGVATADLYPQFSLFGLFELTSTDFSDMGRLSSRAYSFGPAFRWRIFDGNRIRNNIRIEEARTQQLLANYERVVLTGIEEVENAMTAYAQEIDRKKSLRRSVEASKRSVELVDSLYRNGLTDFQNVLDMQRTLFVQQDRLAFSEGLVLQDLVRLYKALGGGWALEVEEADGQE